MTTTGTSTFNLDVSELVEEAYERCGAELRSGYNMKTARRSLNLITIEWANQGINMWTIEEGSLPVYTGTVSYDLPVNTVDLLDHVIRTGTGTGQTDLNITRISESTYSTIPNKLATGRPIQVWVNRRSGATYPDGITTIVKAPQINIWPSPDQGSLATPYYTFVYWRMRRIQDAGNGINTQDIPFRFLNALVAGLAYYLSIKIPGVDPNRITMLKQDYQEQFTLAAQEDRETASSRFVPRVWAV